MGWDWSHRYKGQSNREFFSQGWDSVEILADSTINNVWYAAVRVKETGQVFAAVYLISRAPRSYYNFGYKSQSEDMGPNAAEAPKKILDLLSPTDNEYALEWRKRCQENLAKKAAAPKAGDIKVGDIVRLHTALHFTNGMEIQEFTVVGHKDRSGRIQKRLSHNGIRYQVPRWRERVAEVIPA
jgi:hypothetical protein